MSFLCAISMFLHWWVSATAPIRQKSIVLVLYSVSKAFIYSSDFDFRWSNFYSPSCFFPTEFKMRYCQLSFFAIFGVSFQSQRVVQEVPKSTINLVEGLLKRYTCVSTFQWYSLKMEFQPWDDAWFVAIPTITHQFCSNQPDKQPVNTRWSTDTDPGSHEQCRHRL